MFTKLLTQKTIVVFASFLATTALTLATVLAPVAVYAASPLTDPTPGPFAGTTLTFACNQEKLILQLQQNRLTFATQIVAQAQAWIAQLNAKGKDTSTLTTALTGFQAAITTAQGQHATAQDAYNSLAGFDGSCNVTDRKTARESVRTVREDLRTAQQTLGDGLRAFRLAARQWREANRPAAAPTPSA